METLTRTLLVRVKADNVEDAEAAADDILMEAQSVADSYTGPIVSVLFEDDEWAENCSQCGATVPGKHEAGCRA